MININTIHTFDKSLEKSYEKNKQTSLQKLEDIIKKIEAKTNLTRNMILCILAFSYTCIWFGIFDIYLSYILTIYFPIIWSLNEMQHKELGGSKQWLAYWVFFALFVLLDMIYPLIMCVVPFYLLIRTTVLLWISLPNNKGALTLYNIILVQTIKYSKNIQFFKNINKYDSLKLEIETLIEDRNIENEILLEPSPGDINPTYLVNSNSIKTLNTKVILNKSIELTELNSKKKIN